MNEKNYKAMELALLKIYDPVRYHHWESDPYTRAACLQQVAFEALTEIGTLNENGNVKHPIQEY